MTNKQTNLDESGQNGQRFGACKGLVSQSLRAVRWFTLLVHVSTAVKSFAQAWNLAIFRLIRVKQVIIPVHRKREKGSEDSPLVPFRISCY